MSNKSFPEIVNDYLKLNKFFRFDGEMGVKHLCHLVHDMGYKDPMNFGRIDHKISYGDLINFLEDNPGAQETLVDWIKDNGGNDKWQESLEDITYDESETDDHE